MSDSNDPQTGDINVGFDGTNITINNRPITVGDYTNLFSNTRELLLNENISEYMMIRTICDIIKDATNARVTVPRNDVLIPLLNELFPRQIVTIAAEPAKLEEIKAISNNICEKYISGRVFIKSAYTDHIPLQVTHVFNESGADPDTFSPGDATIMSSFASVADPATRKVPTDSYPEKDKTLRFDANFMSGLVGFLAGTTWQAKQTSDFGENNTEYSFGINVGVNNGVTGGIVSGNNVTNNATNNATNNTIAISKTDFSNPKTGKGYYFQGNPTKNKFIYNNVVKNQQNIENPEILREILRYMIIKEMGDMTQVYVMLVWFYLQNTEITKDKFVMSTTDLVVMNTCQLFQMPCLYTNQGKDTSLLTEQEKELFDDDFNMKMTEKTNGTQIYNNWKKNNKFANTLYYLPFEESSETLELKKRRRLETLYYVLRSQNEKQLELFTLVSGDNQNNYNQLRYIKMGRLGPLLTYFNQNRGENDQTLKQMIKEIIIPNIQMINWNLYHECLEIYNSITGNETHDKYNNNNENNFTCDEKDQVIRSKYSLNILITKQKYPPNSQSYIYVIQNLTHYTENYKIGWDVNNKLVDMIINDELSEKYQNVEKDFEDTSIDINNEVPKKLGETPRVDFPQITQNNLCGPNENWLIYSIANWFNGVRDQLNTMFGDVFQPFNFFGDLNTMDWMGIGGKKHNYQDNPEDVNNNLQQPYINIGFVTMMPSIYEQLCSIYEKHNIVYNDVFGETFISVFISNLTRYGIQESDEIKSPILKAQYNDIDHLTRKEGINKDFPEAYFFNLIPDDGMYSPYEKCVIHTADIEFDIENVNSIDDTQFKDELKSKLEKKKIELIANNNIDNNVFTVDDKFAQALFTKSGITFNEPQEQLTTQFFELQEGENDVARQDEVSGQAELTTMTPEGRTRQNQENTDVTPIKTPEYLQIFLSPEKSENKQNKKDLFSFIITPLKQKQIKGLEVLENISFENILEEENSKGLIDILEKINKDNDNIILNDDPKLKQTIKSFIERGIILPDIPLLEAFGGTSIINGNKKTRRRNKRSHKKHHKTNKRHKKYQKSGKNKTRKIKKAKRKNKTV